VVSSSPKAHQVSLPTCLAALATKWISEEIFFLRIFLNRPSRKVSGHFSSIQSMRSNVIFAVFRWALSGLSVFFQIFAFCLRNLSLATRLPIASLCGDIEDQAEETRSLNPCLYLQLLQYLKIWGLGILVEISILIGK
jgi:hypothetical protein